MSNLRSGDFDWAPNIQSILASHSQNAAWITDEEGHILIANKKAKNNFEPDLTDFVQKHRIKIDSRFPEPFEFPISFGNSLQHQSEVLFSASKFTIKDLSFYLFVALNTQKEPIFHTDSLLTGELGIYFWQLELATNAFFLDQEGWKNLLGVQIQSPDYEDFYSCLSLESIQKFALLMEEAINYGKAFATELLIDLPGGFKWIWFSCSGIDQTDSSKLKGFIKDLTKEKAIQAELDKINLWLNSGLARFKVEGAEGEILKDWTGPEHGKNIQIEGFKRQTTLFDFRNKLKYKISADLGQGREPLPVIQEEAKPENIKSSSEDLQNPLSIEGSQDQKFIKITQWLGQSLDAQVSAIGIFKKNQFEWKAWWKSPIRSGFTKTKNSGEWTPPLNWLEEIEGDKESQAIWWPQDLLPFSIEENFGDGWMLLTDSISPEETTLFAVQSEDPSSILEKTQHVIKGISLLKPIQNPQVEEDEIEKLKRLLKEKDTLLKELNHRAKNNFSIASGLVKMQASYIENEECNQLLRQTQKRLETLASVHEQLYLGKETSGILDMKDYLTRIINGLVGGFSSSEIKVELNLDPIHLDLKKANTIALLVNELISNSFKYAFSKTQTGILKIDFLEKGQFYKLRVSDNGPGIKSSDGHDESLGKILIDEFVKQLKGTMEIVTPPGTTYLITFAK